MKDTTELPGPLNVICAARVVEADFSTSTEIPTGLITRRHPGKHEIFELIPITFELDFSIN